MRSGLPATALDGSRPGGEPGTTAAAPRPSAAGDASGGRGLPGLIVIGAMKAGTTAVHRHLDAHPHIGMAEAKEVNFFFGPDDLEDGGEDAGSWHCGLEWYVRQLPAAPLRGEASPGYTSPSFPAVAGRMARVVPGVRIVYMVRDPVERALSQYRHHRADGTERRAPAEALLDPASQYMARSRFHARLRPYLRHFSREQIFICSQEELLHEPARTTRALFGFLGVDQSFRSRAGAGAPKAARAKPVSVSAAVRRALTSRLTEDADRLRELAGRDFPEWSL